MTFEQLIRQFHDQKLLKEYYNYLLDLIILKTIFESNSYVCLVGCITF